MRNKTPYLTGFSARFCGSAKASAQARTRSECRKIAANSIADTARMFAPVLDARFMHELDGSLRRQSYDQTTTFRAWVGQVLGGNASCSQAVGQVQAWCAEARKPVPASNTAAYCTARGRLRGDFLAAVQCKLSDAMEVRQRDSDRWHGMTLKAIDGSSAQLMDTPANQEAYPQPSVQKPGCGFPVMGFVGVIKMPVPLLCARMKMISNISFLVLGLTFLSACNPRDRWHDYRKVILSGREKIPWIATVEKYFPQENIDHFITHYAVDNKPKEWQTVVYFNNRYRMQIVQMVDIDYKRNEISRLAGEMKFVINEVVDIDPVDSGASYGQQARGGPAEWKRFEDSGGDLSALPLKILIDKPVDNFASYRKAWGKDVIK